MMNSSPSLHPFLTVIPLLREALLHVLVEVGHGQQDEHGENGEHGEHGVHGSNDSYRDESNEFATWLKLNMAALVFFSKDSNRLSIRPLFRSMCFSIST